MNLLTYQRSKMKTNESMSEKGEAKLLATEARRQGLEKEGEYGLCDSVRSQ